MNDLEYISQLKKTVQTISKSYRINKPHRNIIFTDISSPNMNIFYNLLNSVDNLKIFFPNNIEALPDLFYDYRCKHIKNYSQIIDEDIVIAIYIKIYHLVLNNYEALRKIINKYGYRIIAIIRDPIQTITLWNQEGKDFFSDETKKQLINKSINKIEYQAIFWEQYANLLWNFRHIIKIYMYEHIQYKFMSVMDDICNYLALPYPEFKQKDQALHFDKSVSECKDLDQIKITVKRYCPTRLNFGYDDLKSLIPKALDNEPVIFCRTVPKLYEK